MARAATKTELISAASDQWENLWKLINDMPEEMRLAEFNFGNDPKRKEAHWRRDKNLRDVLMHLYEWHQLFLHWTAANLSGQPASFLPESYNWKTYGEMNMEFFKKHQSTPYDQAASMLRESHSKVLAVMEAFTDEELFEKKHFSWTGTSNVGSYCISTTAGHYDWAAKKAKLHRKTYQERG